MRLQVPTPLFWMIYFSLVLFLLLLGETYLGLYIMGAITLYLQFFLPLRSTQPNHPWYKIAVGISSLFIIWLGITTIFSISLPLSHQAVFEWIFIINLFFWFLEVPWDDVNRRYWLLGMLMSGLVMLILGIVAIATPRLSYLIPGMNLIYPTYGHNHLGVLLLLTIPMFWAAAYEWPSPQTRLLAFFYNFSPLITFGRTVVLLTALQVFTVHRSLLRQSKLLWGGLKILGVMLILVLIGKFFLSWYVDQTGLCPIPQYRNVLCKPWSEERRFWYYKQAFVGLSEQIWVGSGPGTFGLVSEKHRQLPAYVTAFVHNDFLQYFVELGIAGGLLVCLALWLPIFVLYRRAVYIRFRDPLFHGIYWGLVSVLLNSFFDFDLNFIGILSLQVMGMAILSRWSEVRPWPTKLSVFDIVVVWWHKWFHSVATFIIVLVCLVYAVTNILLDYGKYELVARWYPYIHWQSKIFYEAYDQLPAELQLRFNQVYWHHSSLLTRPKERVASSSAEVNKFVHQFAIDPWSRLDKEIYSYYLNQGQLRQAEYEILATDAFFRPKIKGGFQRETIPTQTKESLAHKLMWLSDLQFQQGRYAEGINSIVGAQLYVDWVMNDSRYCGSFPTLYRDLGDDFITLVAPLNSIPVVYFGYCRGSYANLYLRIYQEKLQGSVCDERCLTLLDRALQLDPSKTNTFWLDIFPIHTEQMDVTLKQHEVTSVLEQWRIAMKAVQITTAVLEDEHAGDLDGSTQIRQMLHYAKTLEPLLGSLKPNAQQTARETITNDVRWLYSNLE